MSAAKEAKDVRGDVEGCRSAARLKSRAPVGGETDRGGVSIAAWARVAPSL